MVSAFMAQARSANALARQWGRRAGRAQPFILQEVESRMIARAQIMRPVEGGVLHHGWLHPASVSAVHNLFMDREMIALAPLPGVVALEVEAVSPVTALLNRFRNKPGKPQIKSHEWLNQAAFPVPAESIGMVWSPLWLHAHPEPEQCLQHWNESLKPEGGLFFSVFGPDTLRELAPFAALLGAELPQFPDMHDWGDLLGRQGFSDPVMEMERITLTYQTPQTLLADCRALFGNYLHNARPGLLGKRRHKAAMATLEDLRDPQNGRLNLTLELVYGHAWKVRKNMSPKEVTVPLSSIGGRKPLK
ncbi:SAM-dependent methyltransferase [Limnobacter litoralis]|nr:SAM-dependent methyltransferase [Limnobacter litoralis]